MRYYKRKKTEILTVALSHQNILVTLFITVLSRRFRALSAFLTAYAKNLGCFRAIHWQYILAMRYFFYVRLKIKTTAHLRAEEKQQVYDCLIWRWNGTQSPMHTPAYHWDPSFAKVRRRLRKCTVQTFLRYEKKILCLNVMQNWSCYLKRMKKKMLQGFMELSTTPDPMLCALKFWQPRFDKGPVVDSPSSFREGSSWCLKGSWIYSC